MTKKIVICFDGTWNHPAEHSFRHKSGEILKHTFIPKNWNKHFWKKAKKIIQEKTTETNVKKICDALINDSSQSIKYVEGLGTGWAGDRITGGATGLGISKKIKEAYEYLVKEYMEGADIYLFGFSRGAYTARSLSGFLDLVGVLDKVKREKYFKKHGRDLIDDAYRYYRLPTDEADSKIRNYLNRFALGTTTRSKFQPVKDEDFRVTLEKARPENNEAKNSESERNLESITIEFLGVWDTVGALGVPARPFRFLSLPWVEFHDTDLTKNVRYAYQALALHEIRSNFKPVLWTYKHKDSENQEVQQLWFPGSHSDVGGGYKDSRLSNYALLWMIEKAKEEDKEKGLKFCYSTIGRYLNYKKTTTSIKKPVEISHIGIHKLQAKEIRPIEKIMVEDYIKLSFPESTYSEEILDTIFIHPCVCERLDNLSAKELLYNQESSFMSIDTHSRQLHIQEKKEPPMDIESWRIYIEQQKIRRKSKKITRLARLPR